MNRYSLWKYILIAVTLVAALLYTLPNFYGESPAVQISSARATLKTDASLLTRAQEMVKAAGLQPEDSFFENGSVKLRFANTEDQLKAKDVIQSGLGEDYIVALNLLSRTPAWLSSIGAKPMFLGLDLRGGVHFLLQVDMQAAVQKKLDSIAGELRGSLRDKDARYTKLERVGDGPAQ